MYSYTHAISRALNYARRLKLFAPWWQLIWSSHDDSREESRRAKRTPDVWRAASFSWPTLKWEMSAKTEKIENDAYFISVWIWYGYDFQSSLLPNIKKQDCIYMLCLAAKNSIYFLTNNMYICIISLKWCKNKISPQEASLKNYINLSIIAFKIIIKIIHDKSLFKIVTKSHKNCFIIFEKNWH